MSNNFGTALRAQGLGNSEIQTISDIANPNSNEVLIFVAQVGEDDQAAKAKVLSALNTTFGVSGSGKQDFNAATPTLLANFLSAKRSAWAFAGCGRQISAVGKGDSGVSRQWTRTGVLTSLDDLAKVNGVTPAVVSALKTAFPPSPFAIRNAEIVSAKVGGELRNQAIRVTLYALAAMLVYIAFRFEWVYGAAAVSGGISRRPDYPGLFKIFGFEISLDGQSQLCLPWLVTR